MLPRYLSKVLSKRSNGTSEPESGNSSKTTKQIEGSVKSQIPVTQCVWLIITIFLQFLILFFLMSSATVHDQQLQVAGLNPECQFGYVYVYDLPLMFNSDLIDNCHELDPWKKSRCSAVSNGGFGTRATELIDKGIVPKNLSPAWYWTDMNAGDIIYHQRMLNHKCRTLHPEKATGFYVPFYAGHDIGRFLWFNYTSKDRDRHSEMVLDWLSQQPTFIRSNGADHFIMLGRLTWDFRRIRENDDGWGSSLLYMPLMKNVFHLSVDKHQSDDLEESVPYPTSFHPRSESDILQWQEYVRSRERRKLFSFVGGKHEKIKNDFRGVLMDYCSDEDECRAVDCGIIKCSDGVPDIMETFLDSTFCLQPRGNGLTRRSMFDCMLAGSIPVYFWKGTFKGQFEWHLPWMSESFAVFIDHRDVRRTNGTVIRKVLESIHKDKVKEMRETLVNLLPKFIYASPPDQGSGTNYQLKDAFDIALERVLKRFNYYRSQRSSTS